MATFGISMPDELAVELDTIAKGWYTNRSSALTRIFLEWKQNQMLGQTTTTIGATVTPTSKTDRLPDKTSTSTS